MRETAASAKDRFLALLRPLEPELEGYARRLTWDSQQVPDVLQNAVLRAYRAFDRYREDASFRAWMFQILTREIFALNRRHARIARHEFQLEPEELAALPTEDSSAVTDLRPPTLATLQEAVEPHITRALRTLTDTERAVLLLRALNGFRYREISDTLQVPLGTVMGSLARARQKLRAALARTSLSSSSKPQP